MAARFPQSSSPLSWRIKPAYSGKIKAIFWPAGANSLHVLRSGDTVTSIVTRTAGSAGFNATDGLITGNVNGTSTANYFSITSLSALGLTEAGPLHYGMSYYGDIFGGFPAETHVIGTGTLIDTFSGTAQIFGSSYGWYFNISGSILGSSSLGGSDNVPGYMTAILQTDGSDVTSRNRLWVNGAESIGNRTSAAPTASSVIGTVGNPLYLGGTMSGSGNTNAHGEAWWVGVGLTDAEASAITANPSIVIEAVVAGPALSSPTATPTGTTQATVTVSTDTSGTNLYHLVLPAASAAPTDAATLIANGSAVSHVVSSTGVQSYDLTGLTTNTPVKVHFAQAGSNVVSTASFTPNTLAISGTALSAQTGSSGSALTWTGATPNSLLTNSGNGSGTWTVTAGVGSSGITGCNPTTGVPIAATLGTAGSYTVTLTYTDSSTVPAAQTVTKTFGLTISTPDATSPTLTGSISVSSLATTSYTLSWPSATDNVAVTGYEYSLNGGSTYTSVGNALTVNITGRTTGATDQVRVRAFDAAGNRSSALAASVTLLSSIVKTPPLENTDGTLHLASTVHWSWYPGGRIGSFGSIVPQEGTGTTNAVDGTLTIGTLSAGTGVLMTCVRAAGASTDSVHYHFITVT